MKNYIRVIRIVSYFLFNGSFCIGQGWKPQSCPTCCWAAATENVFIRMGLSTNECGLLQSTRGTAIVCNNPTGFLGIDKENYIGLTKKYASFSYLESSQKTLSWNFINQIVKPSNTKPIIFSFDHDLSGNHFVNVYGTIQLANKQWLKVFDPYLTNKGVHYLKNYQIYQLPGNYSGIKSTYWGFGNEKVNNTDVIYKTVASEGNNSILNVYLDNTKISTSINSILNANRSRLLENVTGLKAGDSLIPVSMSSMILLSNIITSFPSSINSSRISEKTTIVQRATHTYIIPIFKDSSNFLIFKSMILLLKNNSLNLYAIDRIQKLDVPIPLLKSDVLINSLNRNRSISLPEELQMEFLMQEDGRLNVKIKDKFFDISFNNINPLTEFEFFEKFRRKENGESFISRELSVNSLNSNVLTFKQTLIDKGFNIQGDSIKINGNVESINDFQQKLKSIPNQQKIIILEKKL